MNLLQRLEANSTWIAESGCRVWLGALQREHGVVKVSGRSEAVHRVAWELENGPIPKGIWVLHTCGIGPCFNTAHLRLGTRQENADDRTGHGGYIGRPGGGLAAIPGRHLSGRLPKFQKQDSVPLDHADLRRQLSYDPDTGIFRHRTRADRDHSWNMRFANEVAGALQANGYRYIIMGPKHHLAHRLAWLYMTGDMPSGHIDHINGDRTDNRWTNLRPATASQNASNTGVRANNKSGVKGVCWVASKGLWRATIMVARKDHFLGYYKTLQEAASARAIANTEHHGEYARLDPSFVPVDFAQRRNAFSGVKGVSFDKKRGLWFASITVKGKMNYLGRFKTFDEAVAARRLAEATETTQGNA